ncbi:SDR family oxidoreductase [Variovorax sp. PAMC28562]|uniref:NAD(P)-dependent oxidoreductase n=1 Tax=Variovorax sp. PAMC28562 TaxID=2762323 RepID=UPI00164D7332|nr:SDR family oxidoreductase [Variovorax sp. PAMC28562]QNK75141.1 SDR family oxidoreductase [Variovorax sp. PAMC28562]
MNASDVANTTDSATARPKILVLGATGGTGRLIVRQALARGYDVRAMVRSPAKASGLEGAEIHVGDARDEQALRKALQGRNAVVSALGTPASPFREVTLLSTATRALVGAMRAEGIKRLVCITGMGAGDSVGHGGFLFDRVIFPALLRKVYADKDRQEAVVRGSGLDWVLVRPSMLNDKASGPSVRTLTDLSAFHGGTIARGDVAAFVLDQVRSDTWLQRAPLISW